MQLELNDDQKLIQDSVRRFADAEVKPGARERDHHGKIARELFPKLKELGLFDLDSLGLRSTVLALEELARHDASLAFLVALSGEAVADANVEGRLGLRSAGPLDAPPTKALAIGAVAVGVARGALEESLAYAQDRKQFGKPISEFQAIQWMLADMAVETDAARLLVRRAADLSERGAPLHAAAEQAKLYATEAAVKSAMSAIQIHGGVGFTREFPVERYLRDAKMLEVLAGGSDRAREVIARSVLVG